MKVSCLCGQDLVTIESDGAVRVGEVSVAFRRHTDFVACPSCLRAFRVHDIRAGVLRERPLWELKLLNEVAVA